MKPNSLLRPQRRILRRIVLALLLVITLLGAVAMSGFVLNTEWSPVHKSADTDQTAGNGLASQATPVPEAKTPAKPSRGDFAAGSIIYIDPKIGVGTAPPPDAKARLRALLASNPAFSTSGDGLRAVPSSVPGGGIVVNLQGRFQSAATAAKDPNGRVTIRP